MASTDPRSHWETYDLNALATTVATASAATAPSGIAGYQWAYVEYATSTTVSATSAATAQAIVSAGAVVFDGTAVMLEYYGPYHGCAATATLYLDLYLDGVLVTNVLSALSFTTAGISALKVERQLTPAAGSHTYEIRMHRGTANWTVDATAASGVAPGFIRISKV